MFEIQAAEAVDIDTELDFILAEAMIRQVNAQSKP
jgi:CMP-N-acetylneuraminic acid synthetase